MLAYTLRRLLLMIPTLFGIMVINFAIVQVTPGGPVEQMVARLTSMNTDATARISGIGGGDMAGKATQGLATGEQVSRGAQGLDPELLARLEALYGFDKPPLERFLHMMGNYLTLDFGESFFRSERVTTLIFNTLPVTISLGLWTTLLVYLIAIPLGIRKAVKDGTRFDVISSLVIVVSYAIPSFLFAILLIILFAGGNYVQWFPLRGLTSDDAAQLSWFGQVVDYLWHITLPVLAMVLSGFASLAMLTKNSFLDEMKKHYVLTARAKGASEQRVLYGHVFRNAMLIVIAGFPSALIGVMFTSALLIEIIFSLNGLGLLGYEAVISRDYPVIFGTLFIFTAIGLIGNLLGDLMYMWVDPRIDFDRRGT